MVFVNPFLIANSSTPCFPYLRRLIRPTLPCLFFQLLGIISNNKCSHFLHASRCQEVESLVLMSIILSQIYNFIMRFCFQLVLCFSSVLGSKRYFLPSAIFIFQKVLFPSKISSHHSSGDGGSVFFPNDRTEVSNFSESRVLFENRPALYLFLIINLFLSIKDIFLFRIINTVSDILSVLLNFIANYDSKNENIPPYCL